MKEIKEKSIVLAKFLGYEIDNSFPDKNKVYRLGNKIELDTTFKFHTDYNELMKVWSKLLESNIKFNIKLIYLIYKFKWSLHKVDILDSFDKLYQLIVFYNSLKK